MEGKNLHVRNRKLAKEKGRKLDLDPKTSDVKFQVGTKKIVSHKNLLSANSTVFEELFYGSSPAEQPIKIHNVSAKAFREFLKFFYFDEFEVKSENVVEVAKLCKKYEVDGLKICADLMQKALKVSNVCSTYAAARSLKMEKLSKVCEKEISQNGAEVLKSADLLGCEHAVFDKILQLVLPLCRAAAIVNACMAWAGAECQRSKKHPTPANMKSKLKDSFDRIPFDKLSREQFSQYINKHKRMLDDNDWESIVMKLMTKKSKTTVDRINVATAKRLLDDISKNRHSLAFVRPLSKAKVPDY
ncbi:BTB/POZ domain-containing protein 6-B-like [Sitodiplosis mosellana]|uniref:BTB/POZ domain-containing protein 6-B-like n=1 Tax=Sitodiplosis mosellana TaxID=263140 RepID=UPI002444471E|nr:BTB/POZ domain-containing protein 6-B-like [Sitodiplosis mosellana]